jgi:hypothetical protein
MTTTKKSLQFCHHQILGMEETIILILRINSFLKSLYKLKQSEICQYKSKLLGYLLSLNT